MSDAMSQRGQGRAPVSYPLPSYLTSDPRRRPDRATRELAQGLGWFSIGLGLTEVTCGGAIARWLGMPRAAPVIQAYGVREILQGAGILGSRDPTPWITARVAGDALDIATVLPGLEGHNPRKDNVLITLLALAGVTAVDVICARNLAEAPLAPSQKVRQDYRRRSGFRRPAKAMRGAARDFKPPPDIISPEAMRPWTLTNA
ncbi:cyclase dehydrase [Methylobacterium planeticum]|uniref:Cyclase dehydrase n=1 Tax=Methylobacterium planeticum TaxID=2615211 RepID=A0A6N6MJ99_9HYPH|nr:cyclase dehydrase [Methylobacterium planeticum]KAB1071213.1 cyclase dehydrase [Methylobacterium planeticum]